MARTMTLREQAESRIRAAWAEGGPQAVTPRGANRYAVSGRRDDRYTVLVRGSYAAPASYVCSCPAGSHERACWHAAATWLWWMSLTTLLPRELAP